MNLEKNPKNKNSPSGSPGHPGFSALAILVIFMGQPQISFLKKRQKYEKYLNIDVSWVQIPPWSIFVSVPAYEEHKAARASEIMRLSPLWCHPCLAASWGDLLSLAFWRTVCQPGPRTLHAIITRCPQAEGMLFFLVMHLLQWHRELGEVLPNSRRLTLRVKCFPKWHAGGRPEST